MKLQTLMRTQSRSLLVSGILIIFVAVGLFYPWYPHVSQALQTQQFPYSYPVYVEGKQQRELLNNQQIPLGRFNIYTSDWYVTVDTIHLDTNWQITVTVQMGECEIFCSISIRQDFGYETGVFTIAQTGTGRFTAPDTGTYMIKALNIDSSSSHQIRSIHITATIPGYITETATANFQVTTWKVENTKPYDLLQPIAAMLIFAIAFIPLIILIAIRTPKSTRKKRRKSP